MIRGHRAVSGTSGFLLTSLHISVNPDVLPVPRPEETEQYEVDTTQNALKGKVTLCLQTQHVFFFFPGHLKETMLSPFSEKFFVFGEIRPLLNQMPPTSPSPVIYVCVHSVVSDPL